jgi:lipoate-protein ligase A
VENLRWVTLQNLDQTFRKFTSTLKVKMEETLRSTVGAIEAAKKKREEHESSVDEERRKFQKALGSLEKISGNISLVSVDSSQ